MPRRSQRKVILQNLKLLSHDCRNKALLRAVAADNDTMEQVLDILLYGIKNSVESNGYLG